MSYDIFLKRKDGEGKALSKQEFLSKHPDQEFPYVHYDANDKSEVTYFEIGKNDLDYGEYFFSEEDGWYMTGLSYGVKIDIFEKARDEIVKVAKLLDLKIFDPQTCQDGINPEDYVQGTHKSSEIFGQTTKMIDKIKEKPEQLLYQLVTQKEDYFITYFITSTEPETGDNLVLKLSNGGYYASKVIAGQTLKDVAGKELPALFGDIKFHFINMVPFDSAKDRHGKTLQRYVVNFGAPYFDPTKKKSKYSFVWDKLESKL
jgi:hypothetical protein